MMTENSTDGTKPPSYEESRHKNIVLFGEAGAGKSSVINLLVGNEVAPTSLEAEPCTLQATKYEVTISGELPDNAMTLNVWDTIGLEEPNKHPLKAIENAYALITDLHAAGGVDLLLFCIRAGRVNVAMQRHHRLFSEFLCDGRVPLAIVVTHLENEPVMEGWWGRNGATLAQYGMDSIAHACITTIPAHLAVYASRRAESRETLIGMLRETLSETRPVYVKDVRPWFIRFVEMLWEFLGSFKRKALVERLKTRCGLQQEDATRLAEMMLAARRGWEDQLAYNERTHQRCSQTLLYSHFCSSGSGRRTN